MDFLCSVQVHVCLCVSVCGSFTKESFTQPSLWGIRNFNKSNRLCGTGFPSFPLKADCRLLPLCSFLWKSGKEYEYFLPKTWGGGSSGWGNSGNLEAVPGRELSREEVSLACPLKWQLISVGIRGNSRPHLEVPYCSPPKKLFELKGP